MRHGIGDASRMGCVVTCIGCEGRDCVTLSTSDNISRALESSVRPVVATCSIGIKAASIMEDWRKEPSCLRLMLPPPSEDILCSDLEAEVDSTSGTASPMSVVSEGLERD